MAKTKRIALPTKQMSKIEALRWIAEQVMGWPKADALHYAYPHDVGIVDPAAKITKTGKKDDQGRDVVRISRGKRRSIYYADRDCLMVSDPRGGAMFKFDPFSMPDQAEWVLKHLQVKHESACSVLSRHLGMEGGHD